MKQSRKALQDKAENVMQDKAVDFFKKGGMLLVHVEFLMDPFHPRIRVAFQALIAYGLCCFAEQDVYSFSLLRRCWRDRKHFKDALTTC